MNLSFWPKYIINNAWFACKVCCANSSWDPLFYIGCCSPLPILQSFHGLSIYCKNSEGLPVCCQLHILLSFRALRLWGFFTRASFNEGLIFVASSICIWTVTFTLQASLPLVPIRRCCVGTTDLLTEWLRGISVPHRDQNFQPPVLSSLTEPQVFFVCFILRSEVTHLTGSDCTCCLDSKPGGGGRSGQPLRWHAVKVIGFFPLSNKTVEALYLWYCDALLPLVLINCSPESTSNGAERKKNVQHVCTMSWPDKDGSSLGPPFCNPVSSFPCAWFASLCSINFIIKKKLVTHIMWLPSVSVLCVSHFTPAKMANVDQAFGQGTIKLCLGDNHLNLIGYFVYQKV